MLIRERVGSGRMRIFERKWFSILFFLNRQEINKSTCKLPHWFVVQLLHQNIRKSDKLSVKKKFLKWCINMFFFVLLLQKSIEATSSQFPNDSAITPEMWKAAADYTSSRMPLVRLRIKPLNYAWDKEYRLPADTGHAAARARCLRYHEPVPVKRGRGGGGSSWRSRGSSVSATRVAREISAVGTRTTAMMIIIESQLDVHENVRARYTGWR